MSNPAQAMLDLYRAEHIEQLHQLALSLGEHPLGALWRDIIQAAVIRDRAHRRREVMFLSGAYPSEELDSAIDLAELTTEHLMALLALARMTAEAYPQPIDNHTRRQVIRYPHLYSQAVDNPVDYTPCEYPQTYSQPVENPCGKPGDKQ